jgi:hypothetical protein
MLICLLLAAASAPALGGEMVVDYSAVALEGQMQKGEKFEARIRMAPYQGGATTFWGTDGWKPKRTIEKLTVTIGGRAIAIPEAAISDLADITLPTGFYVMDRGSGTAAVYLRGGDGSAAFTAILLIEGDRVVSRTIEFVNAEGNRDRKTQNYK